MTIYLIEKLNEYTKKHTKHIVLSEYSSTNPDPISKSEYLKEAYKEAKLVCILSHDDEKDLEEGYDGRTFLRFNNTDALLEYVIAAEKNVLCLVPSPEVALVNKQLIGRLQGGSSKQMADYMHKYQPINSIDPTDSMRFFNGVNSRSPRTVLVGEEAEAFKEVGLTATEPVGDTCGLQSFLGTCGW